MKNKLYEKMFDNNIRLDKIFFLVPDEMLQSHELKDVLEDFDNDELNEMIELKLDEDDGIEEIIDKLDDGFLALVSTPVMNKISGKVSSFSWGWTHYTLVKAPTFEELVDKACKWADKSHENDKEKK